ncbi:hypothetical protein PHACT_04030 [Pseudohongiella acticola]|jgi:hypothetical protein|uniref:Phage holin family protein n=1 Tax=Pseudohongiella acticola TaxID=1524254 RepID=A0A1E8CJG7_9GAMM|nr:hypothetical protein [Pseudohongiella acticola]OFE12407.1 hypothetical protein PHACT_04030 [Pseudohongiella acticola]
MSDEHREPLELNDAAAGGSEVEDELNAWLAWLRQLGALGGALTVLATAEIRLAGGDLRRLLLLALLFLPIIIFVWLGLSVFLSWLAYSLSGMPGLGFFAFLVMQVGAALYMVFLFRKYRRSLTLPMTRRYLDEIIKDVKHGPS